MLGWPPPPHVSPMLVQVPQLMMLPQPSLTGPQLALKSPQFFGTHTTMPPHWFGTPPAPQACGAMHVPQLGVSPPQPSPTTPQVAPCAAQSLGTQVDPPPQ